MLLAAAVVALVWANSPLAASYVGVWQTELRVGVGEVGLAKPIQLWINDGLMAIFFFVVGLEIKREVLIGELASPRRALLPIAAAIGGAIVPALVFVAFTAGSDGVRGWGIAMATDIAFALGLLALLGSRVPIGLKVFVTALAIVDDLLAVLVIAIFYSGGVSAAALGVAAVILVALLVANRLGVRRPLVYGVLGLGLWLAFLQSGVHAAAAGVLLALTIPATTRIDASAVTERIQTLAIGFREASAGGEVASNMERQATLWELEAVSQVAQTPLQRLEHGLHPWVAFAIVPLFALANAGVSFGEHLGDALGSSTAYGIAAGLVIGKQVGILLASWLIVKVGLAALPDGVGWRHLWGAGWVAGIGFTMSLFIAELAYPQTASLDVAKVAILFASLIAAGGGWLVLSGTPRTELRAEVVHQERSSPP